MLKFSRNSNKVFLSNILSGDTHTVIGSDTSCTNILLLHKSRSKLVIANAAFLTTAVSNYTPEMKFKGI